MRSWRDRSWGPRGERHADERLSALLDDELGSDEALAVTRHVADCERCLTELDAIRAARVALRSLPGVDPPADLYERLFAPASRPAPHARGRRLAAAAATTAALVGAAAFLAGSGEQGGTVSPPVDLYVVDHVTTSDGRPLITPVDLGR